MKEAVGRLAVCIGGRLGEVEKVKRAPGPSGEILVYHGVGVFDARPWQSKDPRFLSKMDEADIRQLLGDE